MEMALSPLLAATARLIVEAGPGPFSTASTLTCEVKSGDNQFDINAQSGQ